MEDRVISLLRRYMSEEEVEKILNMDYHQAVRYIAEKHPEALSSLALIFTHGAEAEATSLRGRLVKRDGAVAVVEVEVGDGKVLRLAAVVNPPVDLPVIIDADGINAAPVPSLEMAAVLTGQGCNGCWENHMSYRLAFRRLVQLVSGGGNSG